MAGRTGTIPDVPRFEVRPRIRIVRDDGVIVMGPGKADLLDEIQRQRSIRRASEALKMSYMRAWLLVRVMNEAFGSPLVNKLRGGAERGGAELTDLGREVLRLYREMEAQAREAMRPAARRLLTRLKGGGRRR